MQLKGQTALCQCDTVGTLDTRSVHHSNSVSFSQMWRVLDVKVLYPHQKVQALWEAWMCLMFFEAEFYSGASRNTLRYAQCGGKQWNGRSQCEAGLLTELLWKSP